MSQKQTMNDIIAAYTLAKADRWESTMGLLNADPFVAYDVCRFASHKSGWTFLHQAAYLGREVMVMELLNRGASLEAKAADGRTPSDVAHANVAERLKNMSNPEKFWTLDKGQKVSIMDESTQWSEAKPRTAKNVIHVRYAGSYIRIPKGGRYYVDSRNKVLVGWHGTIDPPCCMGGYSLVK
ncbi:ankyrin repeat protein [Mollivirus sibericum]|uniref:ankyrin repeat protein n=1 Tax=Mollivirus sibericum TaxID=1678078 RepID=UPI0006B2E2BA|nr:ankyrin repeat protein [Mollivirus sibericum]ALD61943.1 ankyrin repeat protein [Mollivirus sibericum]